MKYRSPGIPSEILSRSVTQESFSLPEIVLDKSKACSRRLQNSPLAQTIVIADLALRQDLFTKTLSMSAQMDFFGATGRFKSWFLRSCYRNRYLSDRHS
jgi:hypothetical protein